MNSSRKFLPLILKLIGGLSTLGLFLNQGQPLPASAAEELILKIGLLKEKVKIDDLEQFTKTGELSEDLQPYRLVLTPQIQHLLGQHIQVDPRVAKQFLGDLLKTGDGKKFLQQISQALPESTPEQLKEALDKLVQRTNSLSVLNFLRVYPQDTITVDLSTTARLALQFKASFIQSQLLSSRLERALKSSSSTVTNLPFDPTDSGEEGVYRETFVLRDRSRKRRIPLDIHYTKNTQGPLVVMSHGFAADRHFLRYLARHLASYGFTVVSIEHPGSDINALTQTSAGLNLSQILPSQEFIDRPQDVSFVLTQLGVFNKQDSHLKGKFNTQQVTIIGHSFGGYTALALAGAPVNFKALRQFCDEVTPVGRSPADWFQCAAAKLPYRTRRFKDRRIKQVIAFNPIIGNIFGKNLSQVTVPTLILSSSEDSITPTIPHQVQPFQQLSGEKYLIVALGATHMSITDMSNADSVVAQSTLVREIMGDEAKSVRQGVKGVSLAFIQQLTPEAAQYKSFLTPDYLQSLSDDRIHFRLGTQLPRSIYAWINVLVLGKHSLTTRSLPSSRFPLHSLQRYFTNAQKILLKPEYCTGQLNALFTNLLNTYPHS